MRMLAALLAALAACIPEEGPLMEPGSDCLECHGGGGGDESGKTWTAAGTWGGRGSRVTITDSAGKSFTLRTNQVGNFYTAERLLFPLQVSVDGVPMAAPVTYGGCNSCHGNGGGGQGGAVPSGTR